MGILDSDEKYKDNVEEEDTTGLIYKPKLVHRVLQNTWCQLGFLFFMIGVLTPILLFLFVYDDPGGIDGKTQDTCVVKQSYMMACGRANYTDQDCDRVGCCYDYWRGAGCYHRVLSRHYYVWDDTSKSTQPHKPKTPLDHLNIDQIRIHVDAISEQNLQITLYRGNLVDQARRTSRELENPLYKYRITKERYGIEVNRTDSNDTILTTLLGPTIASDGYWEWTVQLTNETIFGLGELNLVGNQTYIFYNNRENQHNSPTVLAHKNGKFHGMHIETNSALEVTVLTSKMLILKSLTSMPAPYNVFKLHLVMGPTPKDVISQLRKIQKAALPKMPYWALGVHICRDSNSIPSAADALSEVKQFHDKAHEIIDTETNRHQMPYDSDCIHENIFGLTSKTTTSDDKKIIKYINQIKNEQKRFIMSLSPQVENQKTPTYTRLRLIENITDVLYKDTNCNIVNGTYMGLTVQYPHYEVQTESWLPAALRKIPGFPEANGFVLRSNWPENTNYTLPNTTTYFHYMTEKWNHSLSHTIPWDSSVDCNNGIKHYEEHNKYGSEFTMAIQNTINVEKSGTKEMILLTASNQVSSSHAFGVHAQIINATWANLKWAVTHSIFHNLFGNPLVSVPVCGTTDDPINEDLCIRWYIAAATLPLFRISSMVPRRDPFSLKSKYAQKVVLDAINKRYSLVSYLYTITKRDEPMVTPMFYHFYDDANTFSLDEQYMIGDALLVGQILYPKLMEMKLYLPVNTTWYEYWNGAREMRTGWMNVFVVETDWIMYIAGGRIVPVHDFQNVGNSVEETRPLPLTLAVALECWNSSTADIDGAESECVSNGSLYVENGINLIFSANRTTLTVSNVIDAKDLICIGNNGRFANVIRSLKVYGMDEEAARDFVIDADLCEVDDDVYYYVFDDVTEEEVVTEDDVLLLY